MGREHRIPRDSRIRETRDRRDARISPALSVRTGKVAVGAGYSILGIDVGENFLDLAILSADRSAIRYARVALAAIRSRVVDSLAQGIAQAAGPIGPAIALVDSPRAPRDMDCSVLPMIARAVASRGRMIDSALRELLRERGSGVTLSMFPTPPAEYFLRCARSPGCKPHLRAIVDELFGSRGARTRLAPVNGGAIFTRFMLAGFAAFPALEKLGIRAWECFPDLQFRLCANKIPIPPKRSRSEALSVRRTICESVARTIGIRSFEQPRTLDQADAAILALSAAASVAAGQLFEIVCEPEGRFGVPSPVGVPLDNLRSKRVQR